MRKNKVSQSKLVPLSSAKVFSILIILSLVFSFLIPSVISDPGTLTPQPIYGAAEYSTGGPADGAYVEVTSSLGTVTTYVGPAGGWNSGYWQVDVGDPGPNWPDGTSFTVIISNNTGWESNPVTDTVNPSGNNIGTIILLPPPVNVTASATPTNVGFGTPVDFTGSVIGGVSPYSWSWDFGDGNTSTLQNPTHTYQQTGMFTAKVNVTDNNGNNSSDSINITVSMNDLSASANANPTIVDLGETVYFTGAATGGISPYSFHWDFGDGSSASTHSPSHVYESTGEYIATFTVTDDLGNQDSITIEITVFSGFIVETGGPYSGLVEEEISFYGVAMGGNSPYSYVWYFGDGANKSGQTVTHTYSSPGIYTVILIVEDDSGENMSSETTATIFNNNLTLGISGPSEARTTETIPFSGSVQNGIQPYTWSWDFGDNVGTSTEKNPSYAYDNQGEYTVSLTVTDNANRVGYIETSIFVTQNYKPDRPTVSGTFRGKENERYPYMVSTTDPNEDMVFYYVDWGDGENSGWFGPFDSGEQVRVYHRWDEEGIYTLKVKAKDSYGAESDWEINGVKMPVYYESPLVNLLENLSRSFPLLEPFLNNILYILRH